MNLSSPQSNSSVMSALGKSAGSNLSATDQALNDFINKVIDAKQYATLDDESRELLRKQLLERLQDYINASLVSALTDEQVTGFNTLLDTATIEEIQKYLADRIPNMQAVIESAMTHFINAYGVGPDSAVETS